MTRRPPDAEPTGHLPIGLALTPREVYVDDIIGGVPTVHLTPPDGPPIRFTLSADAARVLGMALVAAADISRVTGWGILGGQPAGEATLPARGDLDTSPANRRLQVLARLIDAASLTGAGAVTARLRFIESTRDEYSDVFADLAKHLDQVAAISRGYEDRAKVQATITAGLVDRPPVDRKDVLRRLNLMDEPADPRIYAETADRAQVAALDGFAITDLHEPTDLRAAMERAGPWAPAGSADRLAGLGVSATVVESTIDSVTLAVDTSVLRDSLARVADAVAALRAAWDALPPEARRVAGPQTLTLGAAIASEPPTPRTCSTCIYAGRDGDDLTCAQADSAVYHWRDTNTPGGALRSDAANCPGYERAKDATTPGK